ncbi:VanZ family protein [Neobacillus sp. NPDC097160]|uniref:VanZ family protein n=1 Tax=Neobacillus sp. NPDC097160 TaxID=3364298 RepID=UPI003802E303
MSNRKWWQIATIIWMVVIFLFTQLPYFTGSHTATAIDKLFFIDKIGFLSSQAKLLLIDSLNFLIRKATHLTAFGILSFFLFKSLERYRFSYLLAWCITFLYAMTDEWHQSFVPNRTASFKDVLIDTSGAFIVLLLTFLIKAKKRKKGETTEKVRLK